MAYIGRQLARGENKLFDDISSSFNGSTTTFNLTVSSVATATATAYQLFVSLGGVMQKPNTDFTTAGNQITFTTAPAAGLSCWIMMQGDTIDQAAIPDASVTPSKIAGSGDFAFPADIRLKDADGSHYVGFQAPATVGSNLVWTLPATDGSANQFLQTNASGVLGWGTADVSSAMPLTGGTFTGDVTFDGATAGRDIVWDKSDNALEFADNAKALFGTAGDLEIFHSGSHSRIADTGTGKLWLSGSAVLFSNAAGDETLAEFTENAGCSLRHDNSTKLTTTSTGVSITGALTVSTDATITGDLTVSGTTTTINTQTLDVEDKNVVIGKVSSPSDTTADGGGWTLKGSTDKTFNWINSTDAWTSSEHIHLIDDKKLLVGTGSDLQIYHDSNNSTIESDTGYLKITGKAGDVYLQSDSDVWITSNNAGETMAKFTKDGAATLYHNNSAKVETTSGGINVTGAINVNGSPLSAAPTIDLTASGSITANKGVIVNPSGQVVALAGAVAATGSRVEWESGIKYNDTCKLTDDKYVVAYRDESSNQAGKCRVVSISGTTPSFGSEAQFEQNTTNWIRICRIDSSRFAIIFHTSSANEIEVQIGSVSGTSITYGTAVATGYTGNPGDYGTAIGYQADVNGLLLFGATAGDSDRPYYRTCRPSGTTVNMASGAWTRLESSTGAHDLNVVENTTDNELLLTWISSSQQNGGRSCTLKLSGSSGNHSVTVGQNEYISNQNQYRGRVCYNPDDNVYGYIFRNQDQSNGISQCCGTPSGSGTGRSISWTSYTMVYQAAASTNKPNIAYSSAASRYLLIYGASNNNGRWFVYKQSGTSMVTDGSEGSYETSVSTIANPYMNVLDVGNGKFAVTYPGSTNKGYAVIRQLASTNLTSENFIGFASASYSNGQTATINVVGNTLGGQSSLTPGQRYYVAGDGTISLTAGEPEVIAGTAISSTTLLIKPQ